MKNREELINDETEYDAAELTQEEEKLLRQATQEAAQLTTPPPSMHEELMQQIREESMPKKRFSLGYFPIGTAAAAVIALCIVAFGGKLPFLSQNNDTVPQKTTESTKQTTIGVTDAQFESATENKEGDEVADDSDGEAQLYVTTETRGLDLTFSVAATADELKVLLPTSFSLEADGTFAGPASEADTVREMLRQNQIAFEEISGDGEQLILTVKD